MKLRPMTPDDVPFIHECLRELRGAVDYPEGRLADYLANDPVVQSGCCRIFVGEVDGVAVGMLTCNRYAMPRYLGYGIELEEVVVHPACQGHGHGGAMLEAFLAMVQADPSVRRVTVRTDDVQRAGRLYSRYFVATAATVYSCSVNRI